MVSTSTIPSGSISTDDHPSPASDQSINLKAFGRIADASEDQPRCQCAAVAIVVDSGLSFSSSGKDITTRQTASSDVSAARSKQSLGEGNLGKHTDVLFRYVHGDIGPSDYILLSQLDLMSFEEILNHIHPASADTLPEELLEQVLRGNPSAFRHIPVSQLTQAFCDKVFDWKEAVFQYIPDRFKTPGMCLRACWQNTAWLEFVPKDLMTELFLMKVVRLSDSPLYYFDVTCLPQHIINDSVLRKLSECRVYCNMFPLVQTAPEQRDYATYLEACKKSWLSIKSVPEDLKTEEIYQAIVAQNHYALSQVPVARRTSALCELAFDQSIDSLEWIPENRVTERHRDALINGMVSCSGGVSQSLCKYIPESLRTPELYQACVDRCIKHSSFVPLTTFSPSLLHNILPGLLQGLDDGAQSIDNQSLGQLLCAAYKAMQSGTRQKLIDSVKTLMLARAGESSVDQSELCTWLVLPELGKEFKLMLLDRVNTPDNDFQLREEIASSLINKSNPLSFQVTNKALAELRKICNRTNLVRMPEQDKGDRIVQYINDGLDKVRFHEIEAPQFTLENTTCQGRTLIFRDHDRTVYFKLQRPEEPLSQLAAESLMHRYLAENKARLGLFSEIPRHRQLFSMNWRSVPPELQRRLEEVSVNYLYDRQCVSGYCYETSSLDYATYAWKPDQDCPEAPWIRGMTGMLVASRDLGRWCAMGLLHTSTLPAFHVKRFGRQWLALSSLFKEPERDQEALCGRMGALNSEEDTEQPDFRYSGLADLADYELFGQVKSYLSYDHCSEQRHLPLVAQNICLANYIVETMVANVLVYLKLRREEPDFHIDSQVASYELGHFISQLLDQFARGLMGEDRPDLAELLCVPAKGLEDWLRRVEDEGLYWGNRKEGAKNFATDYQMTGRFDPYLYPIPPGYIDMAQVKQYPLHFSDHELRPTLGAESATFPLMSLVQGLTKFASSIIYTLSKNQHPS